MSKNGTLISVTENQEGKSPKIVTHSDRFPVSENRLDILLGRVEGFRARTVEGTSGLLSIGSVETLWEFGGTFNFLAADTELFLSSTSILDTDVYIRINGLDLNYDEKSEIVHFISGQSQQSVGNFLRTHKVTLWAGGSAPVGDFYLAEADTLSAGVPDTAAKVQDAMYFDKNYTHKLVYTVPAGHSVLLATLLLGTHKGGDVDMSVRIRPLGFTDFIQVNSVPSVESTTFMSFTTSNLIPEKTDLEMRVNTHTNNSECDAQLGILIIDNDFI